MEKKNVIQPQDKYVLRMPDGLRSRIKAYAERQGTSMNYEIVRILEREFPQQWPVDDRLSQLAKMMSILKAGVSDPRIDDFISQFEETVEGIVTGKVTDVDLETREAIVDMWKEYRFKEDEEAFESNQDAISSELDEEEHQMFELIGRTEKFAVPPPKKPNPLRDNTYLMDILPQKSLAELTKRLSVADIEGAREVLAGLERNDLLKRIEHEKLPLLEKGRLREDREAPPADKDED